MADDTTNDAATSDDVDTRKIVTPEHIRELREENKSWRLKFKEAELKLKELSTKHDTLSTELTTTKTTYEARLLDVNNTATQRIINTELKAMAREAGMVEMDALKILEGTPLYAKVKINEAGEVEGAKELIDEAKKTKTYLFKPISTGSTSPTPKPAANEKVDAMSLSAADYAATRKARYGR